MIDNKVKGGAITAPPKPVVKRGAVVDLMEALKQSMKKIPEKKAGAKRQMRKKA
jgi:non-homologous end joining protein Ku